MAAGTGFVRFACHIVATCRAPSGLRPGALHRTLQPARTGAAHGTFAGQGPAAGIVGTAGVLVFHLPLSQFGFLSALTNTLAIPAFISGVLLKSTPGIVGYAVFLVVLFVVNVRFPSLLAAVVAMFIAANGGGVTLIAAVTLPPRSQTWRLPDCPP